MSIKGLTDRNARFPEIGRIRKGAPKEPDRPGADLKYFRVEFDLNDRLYSQMWETFLSHYGPEPDEIEVVLPFPTVEENFETWREAYLAGGLVHRCDGERVVYAINPETGEVLVKNGSAQIVTHDPKEPVCFYGDRNMPLFCKPVGRLRVVMPRLNRLAYLTVLTGSIHDIVNLSRQLEALYLFAGSLVAIPLLLRRKPVKISTPDAETGKRVRREKWLLSIEADPRWVAKKLIEAERKTIPMLADTSQEIEQVLLEMPEPINPDDEIDELEESETTGMDENGVGKDPASQYWYTCYNLAGLDRETAMSILAECDQDYEKARVLVVKQHVPPEK